MWGLSGKMKSFSLSLSLHNKDGEQDFVAFVISIETCGYLAAAVDQPFL